MKLASGWRAIGTGAGDWPRAVYWAAAAVLTATVTWWIR